MEVSKVNSMPINLYVPVAGKSWMVQLASLKLEHLTSEHTSNSSSSSKAPSLGKGFLSGWTLVVEDPGVASSFFSVKFFCSDMLSYAEACTLLEVPIRLLQLEYDCPCRAPTTSCTTAAWTRNRRTPPPWTKGPLTEPETKSESAIVEICFFVGSLN